MKIRSFKELEFYVARVEFVEIRIAFHSSIDHFDETRDGSMNNRVNRNFKQRGRQREKRSKISASR